MASSNPEFANLRAVEQVVGYLNFSSGGEDTSLLSRIDQLFQGPTQSLQNETNGAALPVDMVLGQLKSGLTELAATNTNFSNVDQAESVLQLVPQVLKNYRAHHSDLLFHQPDELLFNSFFIARVMQALLHHTEQDSADQRVHNAVCYLNDFIGHRQVATLESQKIEPYEHEWVGPIPVYVDGVGSACGRYQKIIEIAIQFIRQSDPNILRSAYFDPDRMAELAIDPRAYDFDHPINKRPNHQFGQWDEHLVDNSGFYRRFIVQQVTLDALLSRVDRARNDEPDLCPDELMIEAGAVLAGTILMASGVSGNGPGTFDSNTTLSTLLPVIAEYRDQFYLDLLNKLPTAHRQRLMDEAESRRQPFGTARQHLNGQLARLRASQLVNCRLASIFARMGFAQAAEKQSEIVPVASARLLTQIDCQLSNAKQLIKEHRLNEAFDHLPQVMTLLKRGVECGAIVDPWNILGFEANFSLFQANENTIPDHRAFELVELVERILGLCSLLWSEAAAVDDLTVCEQVKTQFSEIVDWWRKYAAHEVMAVDAVDPLDVFQAAEHVARALNLWHKGGAATGDIQFWAQHAEMFDSPKAYALVIDALLQRSDYKTATALMVHWLSQADQIRLQQGDSSFHNLIWRWISEQRNLLADADSSERETIWNRVRKFHDFLEANAEQYWEVPRFQLGRPADVATHEQVDWSEPEDEDEESSDDLFRAAYEDMTYRDTTDDGIDGPIFDPDSNADDELEAEVDRVMDRLEFLGTLAGFWRIAATVPLPTTDPEQVNDGVRAQLRKRREIIANWSCQATRNRADLLDLLASVYAYPLPDTGADQESMVQYDRHRLFKESLLERIITSCVETENALRMLTAMGAAIDFLTKAVPLDQVKSAANGSPLITIFAAILLKDRQAVRQHFAAMIEYLNDRSLLYVPLSKGGEPRTIVKSRVLQSALRDLLGSLPQLGLILETHELTGTALAMERNHTVAQGAVTEFDELFQVAYTSLVKGLIHATDQFGQKMVQDGSEPADADHEAESVLFDCVEMLTESMLIMWLSHSRTLRLTVLEKVNDANAWERLVEFIERYGSGLFTQHFLNISNIRGILHQGVNVWLDKLQQAPEQVDLRLMDELDTALPRQKAIRYLTLVLEAVYENYNEYRDYNTTTTQSDRGELLYIFLDFLRLRGRYDRVCWNLKPVIWGHEILVRSGQNSVARMWRRSLTERVGPEADKFLNKLEDLRRKYSVQMDTIGRRLEERFAHPMQIDRLRSLVGPAMADPGCRKCRRTFELLQQETQAFCKATAGVGVDLPSWLAALESEVQKHHLPLRLRAKTENRKLIERVDTPIAELREQLEQLPRRHRS